MIERNLWGETVDECAARFLRQALVDEIEPRERWAYGQRRAWDCIRIFNRADEQDLRDFYLRVHAYFSKG